MAERHPAKWFFGSASGNSCTIEYIQRGPAEFSFECDWVNPPTIADQKEIDGWFLKILDDATRIEEVGRT